MPNFSSVSARKPACGGRIGTGLMGKLLFYRGGDAQNWENRSLLNFSF
jgi:hypothetical protein